MHWLGNVVSQTNPSFSHPNDIIGRHCGVQVSGRWKGFLRVVEDGKAWDCVTRISATSRGWKSENGAKKHALEELCIKLHAHFEAQRAREEAERRAREERERIERERIARENEIRRLQQQLAAEEERHAEQLRRQREEQRQQLQGRRQWLNTQLNQQRTQYNHKHSQLVALEQQIATEERDIAEFKTERKEEGRKLLITLGHTGDGKSTFCNRLCGDESLFGNKGPFETSGNGASCTQTHSKANIEINGHKIVIVDTPGFSDSFGRDREHGNKLCKYLKGCGGVNNILLIRNATNVRFDEGFQNMLQQYHKMFGDMFFELLVIVATRIDSDINRLQFDENNQSVSMQEDICKKFELNTNIAVIPIGLENYKESMNELMNVIRDEKYECEDIKSPIDGLKEQRIVIGNEDNALREEVNRIQNEVNSVDQSLNAL